MENYFSRLKRFIKTSDTKQLVGLLVILFSLPIAVYLVQQTALYFSRAQLTPVIVQLNPSTGEFPPDQNIEVVIDPLSYQIGFVRIDVEFDETKLNLASNIQTNSIFNTPIDVSTPAEANQSGIATIVLGLSPGDPAPTSSFVYATLPFTSVSQTDNDSTAISVNSNTSQIVDLSASVIPISVTNGSYTLNPVVATSTPTSTVAPTDTPTNTPTSTPTPTVTNTPTPSPTATVTNTSTPTPTTQVTSTVTPTINPNQGDANGDGTVDLLDYSILFSAFLSTPQDANWDARADFVQDNRINILDYSVLFSNFDR